MSVPSAPSSLPGGGIRGGLRKKCVFWQTLRWFSLFQNHYFKTTFQKKDSMWFPRWPAAGGRSTNEALIRTYGFLTLFHYGLDSTRKSIQSKYKIILIQYSCGTLFKVFYCVAFHARNAICIISCVFSLFLQRVYVFLLRTCTTRWRHNHYVNI